MSSEDIHNLLAYDGIKIIQRKDLFRFSLDSLLLGAFIRINARANRIVDLGTGLAPIPLYLSLKTDKPIIGLDIQEDAVTLAQRSVQLNHLENQITILHADMKEAHKILGPSSADIVTVNPPFFKYHGDGVLNQNESLTISRHEVSVDLAGVLQSAKRLVSSGGMLYLIHRASRIEDLILLLHQYRFVIKRLRFVYTKEDRPAMMILVEARANGNTGDIQIEKPLVIYTKTGAYTEEVRKIFHLGDDQYETKSQLSE